MSELEFLDAERHKDLRVNVRNAGNRHFVQIVAEEVPAACLDYPLFFTKNPTTGSFYLGVVMGLEAGSNLCAVNGSLPDYTPFDLTREGFFLVDGKIALDAASSRIGVDGEALFDQRGDASDALRRIQSAMFHLHKGLPETDALIERFISSGLIEPIDLSLDFDDGSHLRLDGLYSVGLDTLHELSDRTALDHFHRGDLQIAYLIAASRRNIRRLARICNERLLNDQP